MNNGDLISRESLLKKYCKEPAKGDCKNCDWFGDSWCRCEIFGVQIAEATAVDAVEVVHAKWVNPYINFYGHPCHCCSECGFKASYQDKNYCPNCGSRMDGE